MAKDVSNSSMAEGAFPTSTARASMVRVAVKDSITLWAPSVFNSIWYAETMAEFSSERSRLHASASERDRSKEGACTWLGFGAKDGLGRNWGIAELLLPACFVRQPGEGTLGFGQGRIGRKRDRHQSVEGGQCILNGSLVAGALVGVDGMQVSGLPRGAPDRSKICSWSITCSRAKAQPSLREGSGSLFPLSAVKVDPREGAEAATDLEVEST